MMKTYQNLLVSKSGQIFYITINREAKLNALNQETLREISDAFDDIYADTTLRGVILTGSGEKAFVAGADISEFTSMNGASAKQFASAGQAIFQKIESCPVPVIALVNGFALGGGCELAMACHLRVATSNAKFGQPEVNLGIIPGYGGTQRLVQLIGKGRALEYMMTADMILAEQAQQWGLVNHVVADKAAGLSLAENILSKIGTKAPVAIKEVIKCVNAFFTDGIDGYQFEAEAFGRSSDTADFQEGAAAFLEKRKPEFKGK